MTDSELRSMVREVLREALAQRRAPAGAAAVPATVAAAPPSDAPAEPVRIEGDGDLAAFVRRLVALLDDPATAAAVRSGRHRFTLVGRTAPAAGPSVVPPPSATVTVTGTVTEASVARLKGVTRIRLADGAVVTPLARDRLRAMGIAIEGRR
jgi:hypothetical protein